MFGELAQKEKLADAYKAFLARVYQNEPVLSIGQGLSDEKLAVAKAS